MKFTRLQSALVVAAFALSCAKAVAAPAPAPQIFAPGVVSGAANDGSPTFSPDGNTLLFTRSGASWGVILESHRSGGNWSQPRIAAFSGRWNDWSPEFSPDGRYAVFVEIRPDTHANLWRVDRTISGWSTPVRLPDAVNIGHSVWKPSITADGSIAFVSIDAQGHKRLFWSQFRNGAYQPAEPLPFSDGTTGDVDPEVAPDGSFMVFASDGRLKGDPKDHLFAAFRIGGVWQAPVALHYDGDDAGGYSSDDEPHFSPDLKTLYFSSDRSIVTSFPRTPEQAQRDLERIDLWDNGNLNAWSVPLAPLLDAAGARIP